MPPTRGHDLKLCTRSKGNSLKYDAPHTGARLETGVSSLWLLDDEDAPHTGARLETQSGKPLFRPLFDAPHTGARLETKKED